MNYRLAYNRLIERAQIREPIDGYTERHHIVPRCVGGSDDAFNLVQLTPEEHYLAHLLLVRMHPNSRSLLFAVKMMSGQGNNKSYGWVKKRIHEAGFSEEHRKNISKSVKRFWENQTLEDIKARWERNEKLRQLKKDNTMITALIYSLT